MRLEVSTVSATAPDAPLMFRVLLLNDGFSPVRIFRNALVGPTLQRDGEMPGPLSVEPTYGAQDEPILLQPFAFYGRDRFFDDLEAADYVVTAEYASGEHRLTATLAVRGPGRPHGRAAVAVDPPGGGR
jgi:hypothetical protein